MSNIPPKNPLRIAVFDLDQTLVHATLETEWIARGFTVEQLDAYGLRRCIIRKAGELHTEVLRIKVRPYAVELLAATRLKFGFEVYVFTAGVEEYAHALLDQVLDPQGTLIQRHRVYSRADTTLAGNEHHKSLRPIIDDASHEFEADDRMQCAELNPSEFVVIDDRVDCWRDSVCHYNVLQVPRYTFDPTYTHEETLQIPVLRCVESILSKINIQMLNDFTSTVEDCLLNEDLFLENVVIAVGDSISPHIAIKFQHPDKWCHLARYGAELIVLPIRSASLKQLKRVTHILTTDSEDQVLCRVSEVNKKVVSINPNQLAQLILQRCC